MVLTQVDAASCAGSPALRRSPGSLGLPAPWPPARRLGGIGLDCETKPVEGGADLDDLVVLERQEREALELDQVAARRQLGPRSCVRAERMAIAGQVQ